VAGSHAVRRRAFLAHAPTRLRLAAAFRPALDQEHGIMIDRTSAHGPSSRHDAEPGRRRETPSDRTLDPIEELMWRTWARRHYLPVERRSPSLHPIVLAELAVMDEERAAFAPISPWPPVEQMPSAMPATRAWSAAPEPCTRAAVAAPAGLVPLAPGAWHCVEAAHPTPPSPRLLLTIPSASPANVVGPSQPWLRLPDLIWE
jgi:hypothetical protein